MDKNLQKYIAFVKTVELGSFTKAAESLSYSQSGISRMIADLEKEWHVSLLERGKAGIRLTPDGESLLPYAKNLCNAYLELQMRVDELLELETGLIRIGAFSSAAAHWLPNILREFQRDYPDIDYELLLGSYDEIENWILEGRVDCGILRLPAHPDLDTIFLEQDPFLAVLPENHPLAGEARVSLSSLCRDPFLLHEEGPQNEILALFQSRGLTPNVHFTTSDSNALLSMAEGGLGVSLLPELILKRTPYHISVKTLETPFYRKLGLALRDRNTASASMKRFMAYLPYRTQREGVRRLMNHT